MIVGKNWITNIFKNIFVSNFKTQYSFFIFFSTFSPETLYFMNKYEPTRFSLSLNLSFSIFTATHTVLVSTLCVHVQCNLAHKCNHRIDLIVLEHILHSQHILEMLPLLQMHHTLLPDIYSSLQSDQSGNNHNTSKLVKRKRMIVKVCIFLKVVHGMNIIICNINLQLFTCRSILL